MLVRIFVGKKIRLFIYKIKCKEMCQDYYKNFWHISVSTALSFTFEASVAEATRWGHCNGNTISLT